MSRKKTIIPKEKIIDLYFNKNLSLGKIAGLFNTTPVTILNRFKEYSIPTRNISESLKGRIPWNKREKSTDETKEKSREITRKLWHNPGFRKKMKIRDKISSERMKGSGNPMKDKNVSEKVRQKLIGLWVGDKNPMKNPIVREKISKILKGHATSIQTRYKISKSLTGRYGGEKNPFFGKHHTREVKEKSRIRAIGQLVSGSFKNKKTSIEQILESKLIERSIEYNAQFPLIGITVADFYLPKYKVVVYADGDFWHRSRWAEKQGVMEKDIKQNKILTDSGYKVFRFSESEINISADQCVDVILSYIHSISI